MYCKFDREKPRSIFFVSFLESRNSVLSPYFAQSLPFCSYSTMRRPLFQYASSWFMHTWRAAALRARSIVLSMASTKPSNVCVSAATPLSTSVAMICQSSSGKSSRRLSPVV